jgi:hypothetical protein
MDALERGDLPTEDECHCGSPRCMGCDDGRGMLAQIPALHPEERPCPDCGSRDHHDPCEIRVLETPRPPERVLSDKRVAELIKAVDTVRHPRRVRVELSAALRELQEWRARS